MRNPPESDEQLLQRMRAGDESAFLLLYRRLQGGIYRFALQMSGSAAAAEDVTQEVFLALIRDGLGFDPNRGTLSGYLYGIARKQVLRHLERDRGGQPLADEDGEELQLASAGDLVADLTRKQSIESLRTAVLSLPRRYREVVVLCDLEEMDYAAAAEALGCAVGTVRSRRHRARALLVDKLNRSNPDPAAGGLQPARCLI
jgi:RNA polymerase sigma-70 factor, ECF subfamily